MQLAARAVYANIASEQGTRSQSARVARISFQCKLSLSPAFAPRSNRRQLPRHQSESHAFCVYLPLCLVVFFPFSYYYVCFFSFFFFWLVYPLAFGKAQTSCLFCLRLVCVASFASGSQLVGCGLLSASLCFSFGSSVRRWQYFYVNNQQTDKMANWQTLKCRTKTGKSSKVRQTAP